MPEYARSLLPNPCFCHRTHSHRAHQCQGLIADLYDEQGDAASAIKYYKKAVKSEDPLFTPINLFKLGQMYERDGKWNDAVAAYERIEKDFYAEYNKMSIAQYVEAAKAKASK